MKKLVTMAFIGLFMLSCAATQQMKQVPMEPQEITIKIEGVDTVKVEEKVKGDGIHRSMEMPNDEGKLSQLSFTIGNKAFIKIFSGLSVADVTRLWNDFTVLEYKTDIRDIDLFINSPGGDAFSGLALADQIERAQRNGFTVTAHASGIIASAAVPVFAVCKNRFAAPGTIFMVHEAALWKWPGRETASDIRSQNELMILLRDRYLSKLVNNTKLNMEEWEELEKKTTWFSSAKALEWGLVDKIE
jgi:ATP-dependent Clp protease protease subunit